MSAGSSVDPIEAEFLFDVALTYRAGMEAVQQPNIRPGEYLGSGDGSVHGPAVQGSVRWDLNETTGERACRMFFSGVIETDDGAVLAFETLGFGRVSDPAARNRWAVSASLQITTNDPRYAWLSERPAAWLGEFDAATYQHRYKVVRALRDAELRGRKPPAARTQRRTRALTRCFHRSAPSTGGTSRYLTFPRREGLAWNCEDQ